MLHRLAIEESDGFASSQTSLASDMDKMDVRGRSSMSSVYGSGSNTSETLASPTGSVDSEGQRSNSFFHSRKSSSSSLDKEKRKSEDHLCQWLRDGTVVYKSVGLGLMDLVVGTHLIGVANEKNVGTRIDGF
jgi:hypothetical protein